MPIFVPVGEWLPDLPAFQNPGATVASNVIPERTTYRPFPQAQTVSTNALASRCQGAIVAVAQNGASFNYVGDSSALYSLVSGNSFSAVTRVAGGAYATPSDDFWEFTQWGQTVIGVNGATGNEPQQISLGAANFANMSGSPDRAGHIAVVREFVVMGNTSASSQQVRWSAINNANSWTADAATLADSQQLLGDGGAIQRIIGGEYGIIFQEKAIYRMTFVGSPLVFQFDQVQRGIGAYASGAVVANRNLVFFLAEDGFYVFDGSNVTPIGNGKVDRFFKDLSDVSLAGRITAQIDPVNKLVAWAFRGVDASTANLDRILIYNWAFNKWAIVEGLDIEILVNFKSLGYTLDGLDAINSSIDALTHSLDSSFWNAGSVILAAFNSSHRLISFDGSPMAAYVDTQEVQIIPNRRAMVREVWPVTHGASAENISVTTLTRELYTSTAVTGSSITANSTGFAPMRSEARYHRFRIAISAGAAFSDIQGVMVDSTSGGIR